MEIILVLLGVVLGALPTWYVSRYFYQQSLRPSVRLSRAHWQNVQTHSGHTIPQLYVHLYNGGGQLLKPHVCLLTPPSDKTLADTPAGYKEPEAECYGLTGSEIPGGHTVPFHNNPLVDGLAFRQPYAELLERIAAAPESRLVIAVDFGDFDRRISLPDTPSRGVKHALAEWIAHNLTLWNKRAEWGVMTIENDNLLPGTVIVLEPKPKAAAGENSPD